MKAMEEGQHHDVAMEVEAEEIGDEEVAVMIDTAYPGEDGTRDDLLLDASPASRDRSKGPRQKHPVMQDALQRYSEYYAQAEADPEYVL